MPRKTIRDYVSPQERAPITAEQFSTMIEEMEGVTGQKITNKALGEMLGRTSQNVSLYRTKKGLEYPLSFVLRIIHARSRAALKRRKD